MHIVSNDTFPHDVIGPALRDLDASCEVLQQVDPARLYGDRAIIAGGIQALTLVLRRIEALQAQDTAA